MDFIDTTGKDIQNNPDIARYVTSQGPLFARAQHLSSLSRRLQRTERAAFHPYSRGAQPNRRSPSPPPLGDVPSLMSPSSNSSETLDTFSSFSSAPRVLRHSISSMSSISMTSESSSGKPLPDPRVRRIRRSESVSLATATAAPVPASPKPAVGVKRAPSYGAMAQEVRRELKETSPGGRHERRDSGSYPSSDEEEKARSRNAKKARVKTVPKTASTPSPPSSKKKHASPAPPPVPEKDKKPVLRGQPSQLDISQILSSPPPSSFNKRKVAKVEGALGSKTSTTAAPKRPAPMNLQRNPSIFGPELPPVSPKSPPPVTKSTRTTTATVPGTPHSPTAARPRGAHNASILASSLARSPSPSPLSPASALACALSPTALMVAPDSPTSPASVVSPQSQKAKTLRRVRRFVPARRISFGSMRTTSDDMDLGNEVEERSCLGSAFQLI